MSKHTPGPWSFNGRVIKRDYRHIGLSADAGETIAAVTGGKTSGPFFVEDDNECIANARLIAAAPDLLDALYEIVAGDPYCQSSAGVIARAAISKATSAEASAKQGDE